MDYNLLICAANKQWTAIDINAYGDCDRISFDGNDSMEVESSEAVADFCEHILNYYNIDGFSDIELSIKIVVVSEYSCLIADLFLQMNGAKSINVVDSKSIMPIYMLKNCIVKPGDVIDIKCLGEKFTLQVDDAYVVSYVSDKAGEEIIMEPEAFSILFRFDCKNLISDETELKALEEKCKKDVEKKQGEIDEQKKLYSELKKKYDELEKHYIQLQNEVEENMSKYDAKRTILRFSTNQLKESNLGTSYHGPFSLKIDVISDSTLSNVKKKYICKLLKADGEVVKKGTKLIEITEFYNTSDNEPCKTGKKCIITADADGRIFYLVKNNDSVNDDEAVILLSDPADKKTDIMKWYKEMK